MRFAICFFLTILSLPAFSQESTNVQLSNADAALPRETDPAFSYEKGKLDAKTYYKKYKMPATMTILAGSALMLASPVAGLGTAIGCSSTPPKIKNLGVPDSALLADPAYMTGYRHEAKKIKQKKIWKNWGIGFAINVSVVGLILLMPGKGK